MMDSKLSTDARDEVDFIFTILYSVFFFPYVNFIYLLLLLFFKIRLAVVGKPNVGKSTLVNSLIFQVLLIAFQINGLVGETRVLTGSQPGKSSYTTTTIHHSSLSLPLCFCLSVSASLSLSHLFLLFIVFISFFFP